jgi:hypothetical protein
VTGLGADSNTGRSWSVRNRIIVALATLLVLAGSAAYGQQTPASPPVTREEYENLKTQLDQVQRELADRKEHPAVSQEEVDKTIEDIDEDVKANRDAISDLRLGTTNFLLTGYAVVGYTDREDENSSFSTGFNPIFLWQMNDRLFFEGELEFEFEDGETEVMAEYADVSYVLNDYLTAGGGKFLLPLGVFNPKIHPAWINKLPDRPLPYSDDVGIAPEADLGAFLRGGAPIGLTKINYDAYVSNGPALITDSADDAGKLNFDNTDDNNDNKAVGGRIGWLPVPELEVGYSVQFAQVNPSDFEDTNALIQAVDASWRKDIDPIRGTLELRGEWVWSQVDEATYDSTGSMGFGPLTFSNDRSAGYLQAAYRASRSESKVLRSLEFVGRYDILNVPSGAPASPDENRPTFGVDYWVTPSFVVKTAYQLDNRKDASDQDAFFIQAALGF